LKDAAKRRTVGRSERRLEWALSVLLEATRTTRRNVDLLTAAQALSVAKSALGGLSKVSERIGISVQMLRDFACVDSLCPTVKQMYAEGRLTSVDAAVRLSRLRPAEQKPVARSYEAGKITSKDVRDIVAIRRRFPDVPIRDAIVRVKKSRDITRYVIKFPGHLNDSQKARLRRRFGRIIGCANVVSLRSEGKTSMLVISEEGEKRLRREASKQGISKRDFVHRVMSRGHMTHEGGNKKSGRRP